MLYVIEREGFALDRGEFETPGAGAKDTRTDVPNRCNRKSIENDLNRQGIV